MSSKQLLSIQHGRVPAASFPSEATQQYPPLLKSSSALYLDFDGTLAELAMRPDNVVIPQHLPSLLSALQRYLDGAVAIITGRSLANVDALLAPAILPGAGLHGAELRLETNGVSQLLRLPEIAGLAHSLRNLFANDGRILVEDKGAALALHFRMAPERGNECIKALREQITDLDLEMITGNKVVEARPKGANKGDALRTLAVNRPFAGRIPIFVGDDTTDEDGFAAAAELGGAGIKVGNGASAAQYRCHTVQGVYGWLHASLEQARLLP